MNRARTIRWLIVLVIIFVFSCGWADHWSAQASPEQVRVLITYVQGEDEQGEDEGGKVEKLIEEVGGSIIHRYKLIPGLAASVPEDEIDTLEASPLIESVELDTPAQVLAEVTSWGVVRINADDVHPTNKGTGIKVAILDSGIDLDHPDLNVAGNVTFVEGTTNGDDALGHGTMVAGVVAALINDTGVVGVAPEVELYSVRIMETGWLLWGDVIAGIEWACENDMQVINMSFGTVTEPPKPVKNIFKKAGRAGLVQVAASGKMGHLGLEDTIYYPAKYPQVIAVGATDETDTRIEISSTGPALELSAPGDNIYTTTIGGYGSGGGASLASAHVTGVAALVIASGITDNDEVREKLQQTAYDLGDPGWDAEYGYGLVDAYQAVAP